MKTTARSSSPVILPVLFALCTALASPVLAEKQKSTDLSGFPLLWSAKKTPLAAPFIPGLNAALLLSEEQKEKLCHRAPGNPAKRKNPAARRKGETEPERDRGRA